MFYSSPEGKKKRISKRNKLNYLKVLEDAPIWPLSDFVPVGHERSSDDLRSDTFHVSRRTSHDACRTADVLYLTWSLQNNHLEFWDQQAEFTKCYHSVQQLVFQFATKKKLTPWSTVLPEKLTVPQLVKKFPAFYGPTDIMLPAVLRGCKTWTWTWTWTWV